MLARSGFAGSWIACPIAASYHQPRPDPASHATKTSPSRGTLDRLHRDPDPPSLEDDRARDEPDVDDHPHKLDERLRHDDGSGERERVGQGEGKRQHNK